MKTSIYIAVRGGVVQGVRLGRILGRDNREPDTTECYVVDYDNRETDAETEFHTEEDYERSLLDGKTWEEISETSEGARRRLPAGTSSRPASARQPPTARSDEHE